MKVPIDSLKKLFLIFLMAGPVQNVLLTIFRLLLVDNDQYKLNMQTNFLS